MFKKLVGFLLTICLLFSCASSLVACDRGDGGKGTKVEVRNTLSECTVNILFAVEEMPYDATSVETAVNNQLKKDGKPYKVHFEYTSHSNYAVTIGDYCKSGYDGAWSHVTTIQALIEQEIIKTDIMPYLDVWGSKIKQEVSAAALAQFTNYKTNKLYAIPRDMPTANDRSRVTIREDWMKEAGLNKVTTIEELDQYLAYCQNKNVGTSGFHSLMLGCGNVHLLREYCPSYYFPIDDGYYSIYVDIDSNDYKVKCMYNTEAFTAWVAKANEYMANGYVSKDSITSTENYFYNGLSAALPSYSTVKMSERIDAFKNVNPSADLYEAFIESEDNPKVVFFAADNCMVALSQSTHTEEFIDFLSWTKNQKNHDLLTLGVEGVNYYLTSNGRVSYVNPANSSQIIPQNKRFYTYNPYYAFNDIDYQRFSANLSDEYVDMVKNCQKDDLNGQPENYILSPLCGFNVQETSAYKTAYNRVSAALAMFGSLVDGKSGVDEISEFVSKVNANGMSDLIAEVQKQLDDYIDKKNIR